MHTTEESFRLIEAAQTVELMAFSPDGDPLAMVRIEKSEALELIARPVTMGHVFRASQAGDGRVFVEAVESDGHAKRRRADLGEGYRSLIGRNRALPQRKPAFQRAFDGRRGSAHFGLGFGYLRRIASNISNS